MPGCDEFEIQIEMRLHGALEAAEAARLDAHLSTCERCRAFEATARRTEAAMRGAADRAAREQDWEKVRQVVERWHRRTRMAAYAVLVPFVAALAGLQLALRRGRPREELLLVAVVVAGLAVIAVWTLFAQARRAARAPRLEDVVPLLRRQLARRARVVRVALLLLPLDAAWFVWQAARDGRHAVVLWPAALLVGVVWVALLTWKRPQLARDRAVLDGVEPR